MVPGTIGPSSRVQAGYSSAATPHRSRAVVIAEGSHGRIISKWVGCFIVDKKTCSWPEESRKWGFLALICMNCRHLADSGQPTATAVSGIDSLPGLSGSEATRPPWARPATGTKAGRWDLKMGFHGAEAG